MSISSTTNRVSFAGNGVTTVFSFPYYFLANADLVVILRVDATGVETTKTITTHYTVSGAGESAGGSVTMLTAPASGETLIVYREPTDTQTLDLVENDNLPAEEAEKAFDKRTMITQRLKDRLDRAVRLTDGFSPTFDTKLPSDLDDAGGKVPLVNAGGTGWATAADWPSADDIENAEENATAAAASAVAAASSASAASTSASAAATSATSAQNAVNSVFFRDVVYITSADSPFTVTNSHRGKLLSANATSGAIAITMPAIAGLDLTTAFVVGVQKSDSSANAITVSRASTDVFNPGSGTTKVISLQGVGAIFTPDTDQAPDEWLVSDQGMMANGSVSAIKAATSLMSPTEIMNLGLAASVGSSAMTIALKDSAGNDPSATSPVRVAFRNATLATGTPSFVDVTAALSTVISSGSTAGTTSAIENRIYVYLINNAGAAELAWSGVRYDENAVVSTTAEGGAGAADSGTVMYSTTARSNVACRYIGYVQSTQATAGTWATAPSAIGLYFRSIAKNTAQYLFPAASGYGSTNTAIPYFGSITSSSDPGGLLNVGNSSTDGFSVAALKPCMVTMMFPMGYTGTADYKGITKNSNQLTTTIDSVTAAHVVFKTFSASSTTTPVTATVPMAVGDILRPHLATGLTLNGYMLLVSAVEL